MDEKQYQALVEKVGKEAADKIKSEMEAFEKKFKEMIEANKAGTITDAKFKEYQDSVKESLDAIKKIAEKQGTTITELSAKLNTTEVGKKTIAAHLKEDEEKLRAIYKAGTGRAEYLISVNSKGEWVMVPFDTTKAAGPHATVDNVTTNGNTSSVTQSIDGASLLRMGADAAIVSNFRNVPWVFALCNLVNVGFDQKFAIWFNESAKQGAPAVVAEGGTKPLVQYAYELKTSSYKKQAMLVAFTEEFALDFPKLQSEILRVSQVDLINAINAAILPNIVAAATAYDSGAAYKAAGDPIAAPNDWDAIAAMAAQVETSTFSSLANSAVVSTNKKYRMGTLKDQEDRWLNPPDVLNNIGIVSNPGQTGDNVLVGDLKQYNIMLRGGIIVRIGYNGTDFAENKFSTVIEQYYFDYISDARKSAIVKGPDFAAVKAAISA